MATSEFDGRVALITGAGAGIGRTIARLLAERGATVVLTDKHAGRLEEATEWVAAAAPPIAPASQLLDIEHRDHFDRVFKEVEASLGAIQIYVWNAALNIQQPIFEHDPELFDRIAYANINNCWYSCQGVAQQMKRAGGGSIVMVGSIAPDLGATEKEPPYGMSKAAVRALMYGIARAGGPDKIRCNEVIMGLVEGTRFTDSRPDRAREESGKTPMGRNAHTEDIAEAVAFLASDRAAFVSGEVLNVTGALFGSM